MNTKTIEDCLELLVGFQTAPKGMFTIKKEDYNILTSIGRQVVRGIGLTDRQHELLKTKLLSYSDMYEDDITKSLDNLRIPLRKLNREKTIKLVHNQLPSILGASGGMSKLIITVTISNVIFVIRSYFVKIQS